MESGQGAGGSGQRKRTPAGIRSRVFCSLYAARCTLAIWAVGGGMGMAAKIRDMVHFVPTKGRALLEMTVKNILYDRKTLVFFGLSLLLLIIPGYWAYIYDGKGIDGLDLFEMLMMVVYLQFIILYACLLFGTSLLAEEEENRTMTYLTSRPVSTFELVMYKYIGFTASVFVMFLVPFLLDFGIIATRTSLEQTSGFMFHLGQYLALMLVAIAGWGALFMFFGAFFRKYALMVGLLYALLWETFIANIGTGIRYATVNYYIRSLAPVPFGTATGGTTPWSSALAVMAGLAFACIVLTWYVQRNKDYD